MKVISVAKNADLASITLSGCPMKCGYCMHVRQERKDLAVERIISDVCTLAIKKVYVGGMEPLVHRKELLPLVQTLKQRGLEVTLKTSGFDPEFLKELIPFVDKFVFEIKAPLDDIDGWSRLAGHDVAWTMDYLEKLKESLELVNAKPVKFMTRAIPGFISLEGIERIGRQMEPYAKEAVLSQFLGNRMNDYPWNGIIEASPPEAEMITLGETLARFIPFVKVTVAGSERVFRR